MTDMTVANTILAQLGGPKFRAMTGAKHFVGDKDTLSFQLPARFAKDGINAVRVKLDASDTYTVTFLKIGRNYKHTTVREVEGVYADSLQNVFENTTGLHTSL